MEKAQNISKELIRGVTDGIVLNILSQADSYGYKMTQQISSLSNQQYEINEATLYTVFRRLVKKGLVTSYYGNESQGGRRKYYQITDAGKSALDDFQNQWEFSKEIINQLVTGELKNDK
ncbi:PadR family transcriptional regulator [Lentilactobacillus kosonis]|uniref:Transcriptional regulator, PadR family n=1 Tax=Lentilactobacillus kosonis TaxID=2810561 RepID=A0A401FPZ2_9LACO|nr:PadR family transcriptional regulator [Lentilactobacillus kosonis]GAY74407.1 transcriptional regulator, PadR family [Lentilactobacillus kosonis]